MNDNKNKWVTYFKTLPNTSNTSFDAWFDGLSLEEREDIGLLILMKERDRKDTVDEDEFLESLKSKG